MRKNILQKHPDLIENVKRVNSRSEEASKTPLTPISAAAVNKGKSYWPAYMLSDWSLERAGRLKKADLAVVSNTDASVLLNEQGSVLSDLDLSKKKENEVHTAAMVIIGDEILNGFTNDVNLKEATTALASIGIPLKQVAIVSDNIDDIVHEVRRLSQKYDIVITSGGIGPTHDDVTIKAIALALNEELHLNTDMLAHLEEIHTSTIYRSTSMEGLSSLADSFTVDNYTTNISEDMKKMAILPESSEVRFPPSPDDYYTTYVDGKPVQNKTWPILQCDNIFVLPGIPKYFASKMKLIVKYFLKTFRVLEKRKIVLDLDEKNLVKTLNVLVESRPDVKVGSYPFVDHPDFKTIITVEGEDMQAVDNAVTELLDMLPSQAVLRVESIGH